MHHLCCDNAEHNNPTKRRRGIISPALSDQALHVPFFRQDCVPLAFNALSLTYIAELDFEDMETDPLPVRTT